MRNSYSKFLAIKNYLKNIDIPVKEYTLGMIFSLLISLLVFSGPIAILINLLIFNDTLYLVGVGIGIIAGLIFTVAKMLFYKHFLKDNKIEGMWNYYLFDGIYNMILCVLLMLIIVI